ncbi:endonuclease III [Desulfovibrio sp. X2]|uniref:endonuclease III n=1 Tax=Desulfovibrio sp. X2 TaxID=941449 RepID=UPI000358D395|nr:endonuclease III [Desulfovibrio sp. X2]EPR37021.1 endonuclease III [Desulfovibrio sp. X2]
MTLQQRAASVYDRLCPLYPPVRSFLDFTTPWQLLVATILSAQCTDQRVNMVTPGLFARWPEPKDLAAADIAELEEAVRSTGFFRNKARNIKEAARIVAEELGGVLPDEMDRLLQLPGVARKTANIVLTQGFGKVEGIAVDTHVRRLAQRLGLSDTDRPEVIERDLCAAFRREVWGEINHLLIQHGRNVCIARLPRCSACAVVDICPKKGVTKSA